MKNNTCYNFLLLCVDMEKDEYQTAMPYTMYAGITEEDLRAIFENLQTVKPVNNTVERFTASVISQLINLP